MPTSMATGANTNDHADMTLFQGESILTNDAGGNQSVYLSTIKSTNLEPEKKLLLAVLEDALWCLRKFKFSSGKKRTEYLEALEWVKSEEEEHPFSFVIVCGALGFDPDYLRQGILRNDQKQSN